GFAHGSHAHASREKLHDFQGAVVPITCGFGAPFLRQRASAGDSSVTEPLSRGRRPVPRVEDFPHRTVETIRFVELDRRNHTNHAWYATFFKPSASTFFCEEK